MKGSQCLLSHAFSVFLLNVNVHSSFTHHSHKLEANQMSTDW